MNLIQTLLEASSLSLKDLKKAMQKDKRVESLFKKDSTLSDVEDPAVLLATVKYWLFNNVNVKGFVEKRSGVKNVDVDTFNSYRKMRESDLDEKKFEWLKEFVADLFKEHSTVERGALSADARKAVSGFINSNGHYHNLPSWVQNELASVPSLRPEKRVLLYRGLLFSDYSLKSRERYDGTLEKGQGLKFLESVRKGTRIVDLEWDRPSSWTTSSEIATRFAKYGPASSSFGATLNWLQRGVKQIDGALGFIISTFAEPEDILIDVNAYKGSLNAAHGDEGEMILRPGSYTCRIVKKYTVHGEVDPESDDTNEIEEKITGSLSKALDRLEDVEMPSVIDDLGTVRVWNADSIGILRNMDLFKKLILKSTKEEASKLYDEYMQIYREHFAHISEDDLLADKHVGSANANKIQRLAEILKRFNYAISHSKLKTANNSKGRGKMHDLTGEEYRQTIESHDVSRIERDMVRHDKLTDKSSASSLSSLGKMLGVDIPNAARLHLSSAAKQHEVIQPVLDAFYKAVGVVQPSDKIEAIKTMSTLIRAAHRNYLILDYVKNIHKELGALK